MANKEMLAVRKAWYAGTWYTAETESLRTTIEEAVDLVTSDGSEKREGPIRFALLPHAGLTYSARGIAHLIVHAPPLIKRVLILSPSHTSVLPENTLSFGQFSGFSTPLGLLEPWKTGLESHGPDVTLAVQREHAVEMVLPFLAYLQQKQKSPISIAMALISKVTDAEHAQHLASEIIGALGEDALERSETVIIASSDFTHYGQRFGHAPFGVHVDDTVAQKVKQEDLALAHVLARSELGPVFLSQRMKRSTVCGIAGASVVSAIAKQIGSAGWVADYYTSLDVLGPKANDFVAYCSILWR